MGGSSASMDPKTKEKWADYIKERTVLAANGQCLLWDRGTSKSGRYGVCKVKLPGDREAKFLYTHRLAYIVGHGLTRKDIDGVSLSHLCSKSLCTRLEHLLIEEQAINNSRQHCRAEGRCFGHAESPCCMFF